MVSHYCRITRQVSDDDEGYYPVCIVEQTKDDI